MNVYTHENLNRISTVIIDAYRRKDSQTLARLALSIRKYVSIHDDQISKLFSRLMMLYHPDRLEVYRKAITEFFNLGDLLSLEQYAHVFMMLESVNNLPAPERDGQGDTRHHSYKSRSGTNRSVETEDEILSGGENDFISALKQKEYGNLDVVYHKQDLVNTEGEIELSGYHILDLSGLELCVHITSLNLSDNLIYDISPVGYLHLLEEVDLSFNRIAHVVVLSELKYLRILDLSFNQIEDIRSLYELDKLEYVNVIGNPIPGNQIADLRKSGVLVID